MGVMGNRNRRLDFPMVGNKLVPSYERANRDDGDSKPAVLFFFVVSNRYCSSKKNLNRARELILTLGNKHWDRSIMLLHGVKLPKQKATGVVVYLVYDQPNCTLPKLTVPFNYIQTTKFKIQQSLRFLTAINHCS